jgi:phosphoribosylanthranilate isomerase
LSGRAVLDPADEGCCAKGRAEGSPSAAVRVKICGITSVEDARLAVAAGADMIGLNFFPGSKRAVDLERARAIGAATAEPVWRVGVFVNATRGEIASAIGAIGLDAIQLHGDEAPGFARGLGVPVIRAVRLASPSDAERAIAEQDEEFLLCEGRSDAGYGGVGASFDWRWAQAIPRRRLIVAGGLTPDNVARAVRELRPFAVDVASGVESSPGRKDAAKVAAFIEHAKAA